MLDIDIVLGTDVQYQSRILDSSFFADRYDFECLLSVRSIQLCKTAIYPMLQVSGLMLSMLYYVSRQTVDETASKASAQNVSAFLLTDCCVYIHFSHLC